MDRHQPPTSLDRLGGGFFARPTVTVARALLGQRLVRILDGRRIAGIIVETEAYLGVRDHAAHTFGGRRTPRNASMWKNAGTAYIYFTYGMHFCMNLVTRGAEHPEAVLLRALEPTEGLDAMRARRRKAGKATDLCSGPAKLCQALAVNRELDGVDITRSGVLFVERMRQRSLPSRRIVVGPRVGIANARGWVDKPLRFSIADQAHVSPAK